MSSRSKLVVLTTSTCLVVILLLGAVMAKSATPPTDDPYRHLGVFSEVLSRIKSDYVEEPDIKGVTLGAMSGMLEAIDPYASYLNAEQYRQYQKNLGTKRASVGLVVAKKFGSVSVVDVIPGSSAAKAGLNTYDMLESINGIATRDMPLAYAELLLSGDPGTNVEVSVLRVTKPEPQKLTLTRTVLKYPAVTYKVLPDQVGYLRVTSLETGKAKEISGALSKLMQEGAKKLVLDLRNDAYGEPEEGIAVANLFVENGMLGYLQGQKVSRQNFDATASKVAWKLPLVVITNRGTAEGAEIAAGAILDNKRAEVVGEKTYGNAALRKPIPMDDGGAIILSVAKYYSPSGKAIQDVGVTPSVTVVENEQTVDVDEDGNPINQEETQKKNQEDLLLKRAIEVLNNGKSGEPAKQAANTSSAPQTPKLATPESKRSNY